LPDNSKNQMALLENERICLRALEPEDLDALYRWENDTELWRYGSTLTPYSRFALRDYINNSLRQDIFQLHQLRLMIALKATNTVIGTVDLFNFDAIHRRAGVGVLLDRDYQGHGYAAQAVNLLKIYAREVLRLQQLYAEVPISNVSSIKLFGRSGFEESGRLKAWLHTPQGFCDILFLQCFL